MSRLEEIEHGLYSSAHQPTDEELLGSIRWLCRRLRLASAVVEAAGIADERHKHDDPPRCKCDACAEFWRRFDAYRREEE